MNKNKKKIILKKFNKKKIKNTLELLEMGYIFTKIKLKNRITTPRTHWIFYLLMLYIAATHQTA